MKLASVLRDLTADLTRIGVPFAVVGGIAASARGEPRFTRDVDVAVAVSGDEHAEGILFQLGRLGYVVRATVEHDAVGRLATARLQHSCGIVCDLIFATCGVEAEIIRDAEPLDLFDEVQVMTATTEGLLAMKVLSATDQRPRDLEVQTRIAASVFGVRASFSARELGFSYGVSPGCEFVQLPREIPVDEAGVPYPENFDAGPIEFVGTSEEPLERYTASLLPDEELNYRGLEYEPYGIPGYAHLTVRTGGGRDIPALELQLDSPLSLLLTQPVAPELTTRGEAQLVIPRSQKLALAWDRGVPGVWLEVFVLGKDDMLRCGYESERGIGEIPSEMLLEFEAGATVEFFTSVYVDTMAGDARVWFGARRELLVPDRSGWVRGVLD